MADTNEPKTAEALKQLQEATRAYIREHHPDRIGQPFHVTLLDANNEPVAEASVPWPAE